MILCEIYDAVDFVKLSCEQCFNKLIVAPDLIVILLLYYIYSYCHINENFAIFVVPSAESFLEIKKINYGELKVTVY